MAKRTIRRRVRKNKTIRKVMRRCNRRIMKGGVQAHQYSGASGGANANIAAGTQHLLQAQQNAGNTPLPIPPSRTSSIAPSNPSTSSMQGGARTRHHKRRLRYKKSIARKSRHA
jgi:hypothetical protein